MSNEPAATKNVRTQLSLARTQLPLARTQLPLASAQNEDATATNDDLTVENTQPGLSPPPFEELTSQLKKLMSDEQPVRRRNAEMLDLEMTQEETNFSGSPLPHTSELLSNDFLKSPIARLTTEREVQYPIEVEDVIEFEDFKTHQKTEYVLKKQVFLVEDTVDESRKFALKCVYLGKPSAWRVLLNYELEVLKRFSNSPYVIKLIDSKTENDLLYMVLEMAQHSFIDYLCEYQAQRQAIEHSFLRFYFSQMVCAVQYIHSEDIVHCDIKSDNFLINGDRLKLADFGGCTSLGNNVVGVYRLKKVGTRDFMSPEYVRDGLATKALDVWSLACVLYDMIHEETPFEHETNKSSAIMNKEPNLEALSCHPELALLFMQMFEPNYSQRIKCSEILRHGYMTRLVDNPAAIPLPKSEKRQNSKKVQK
ncbi:Dual specificity protein kinase Ttk [Aphelenchoides besseyi]|nr:Dual specificity protein kinase Ttk [Aphelenchoides besseyi]